MERGQQTNAAGEQAALTTVATDVVSLVYRRSFSSRRCSCCILHSAIVVRRTMWNTVVRLVELSEHGGAYDENDTAAQTTPQTNWRQPAAREEMGGDVLFAIIGQCDRSIASLTVSFSGSPFLA